VRQFYCFQRFRCWGLWKKRKKRDCFTPFFQLLRGCVSILLFFCLFLPSSSKGGLGGLSPKAISVATKRSRLAEDSRNEFRVTGQFPFFPGNLMVFPRCLDMQHPRVVLSYVFSQFFQEGLMVFYSHRRFGVIRKCLKILKIRKRRRGEIVPQTKIQARHVFSEFEKQTSKARTE